MKVYVLTDSTGTLSKIGWTRRPDGVADRAREYSGMLGITLQVHAEFGSPLARLIEADAHKHFAARVIAGKGRELFAVQPHEAAEFLRAQCERAQHEEAKARAEAAAAADRLAEDGDESRIAAKAPFFPVKDFMESPLFIRLGVLLAEMADWELAFKALPMLFGRAFQDGIRDRYSQEIENASKTYGNNEPDPEMPETENTDAAPSADCEALDRLLVRVGWRQTNGAEEPMAGPSPAPARPRPSRGLPERPG